MTANVSTRDLEPTVKLGEGGFGTVVLVRNKNYRGSIMGRIRNSLSRGGGGRGGSSSLPHFMALKMISVQSVQKDGSQATIENERSTHVECARTGCPFIIKLFSAFRDDKNYYFLLELCEGGDLYEMMAKRPRRVYKDHEAQFYVAGVAEGLCAMHSCGIAYRDIKLENILLDIKGYPHIADFGLAKKIHGRMTKTVCGTPVYMAPEMIKGGGHDCTVDLWSLGVLMYEMVTGKTPFEKKDMMEIFQAVMRHDGGALNYPRGVQVNPALQALIQGFLQPHKANRLGTRAFAELTDHAWFRGNGFDWDAFRKFRLQPPIKPRSKLPRSAQIAKHKAKKEHQAKQGGGGSGGRGGGRGGNRGGPPPKSPSRGPPPPPGYGGGPPPGYGGPPSSPRSMPPPGAMRGPPGPVPTRGASQFQQPQLQRTFSNFQIPGAGYAPESPYYQQQIPRRDEVFNIANNSNYKRMMAQMQQNLNGYGF